MKAVQMQRILGGKRYNTKTATLIADNVYWDGNNWERGGRNQWLYKTRGGAFFFVNGTFWQGERDTLEPCTREEAIEAYEEHLSEHHVDYEDAFDTVVDEEATAGRPSLYGEPMKQANIMLAERHITWGKAQPGGLSEAVRKLIDLAIGTKEDDDREATLLEIAQAMYGELPGADNKNEKNTLVNEIYDWLYNGDSGTYTMNDLPDLLKEWREYAGEDQEEQEEE